MFLGFMMFNIMSLSMEWKLKVDPHNISILYNVYVSEDTWWQFSPIVGGDRVFTTRFIDLGHEDWIVEIGFTILFTVARSKCLVEIAAPNTHAHLDSSKGQASTISVGPPQFVFLLILSIA